MSAGPVSTSGSESVARAAAVYTGLRMLAFVVCVVVLGLLGLRGLIGIAAALLVSSAIGLFVLRRQRDQLTAALQARSAAREQERSRLRGLLDEDRAQS